MKKYLLLTLVLLLVIGLFTVIAVGGTDTVDGSSEVQPTEVTEVSTEAPTEAPAVNYPEIVSMIPDSSGFAIKWTAYSDAAAYRLFVRGASGWIRVGDTAGLTLRHPNLKDQTAYLYTVRALDSSGRYCSDYLVSGWSAVFRAAPVMTSVTPSGNALKVSWQKVPAAGCYRVYRKEGASWVGIGFADGDTYLDTQVTSGKTYTYTVRAFDEDHATILSAFQASGKSGAFASVPQITGVEARNAGLRISWGKVDGARRYRVFVKTASGWKRIGDTSYTYYDYSVKPDSTAQTYTVRAMNAYDQYISDFSREGMTHTFLPAPKITAVDNLFRGQKISWEKVPGAALYRVYVRNGSTWQKLTDTAADSLTTLNVKNNTSYTYTVRCLSEDGRVFQSGFMQSGVTKRYFDAPEITSVENTREGARVTWTAISGVSRYRVFIKNGASWKALANVSGTRYDHLAAVQGTTYVYTVRAIDGYGNFISGFSATGYTNRYQTAPLLGKVQATADGALLTWEEYEGSTSYRVFRHVIGKSWGRIADVTGTSYTDSSAPAGQPCQYTLRALDEGGKLISDYVDNGLYYIDGALADGQVNVNGYLVTFDRGKLKKGYVTAQDIINIAQKEVGTRATNYKRCKYNTWYYGADVSGDCYDWCVVFVEWVFNQAGARDLLYEKTAGSEFFGQGFYQHGRLIKSNFKVGDILIMHWRDGYSSYVPGVQLLNHVGIIIAVNDDGSYTTIEGNTGDSINGEVMIKRRYPEYISCACRPQYGFTTPAA